MLLRLCGGSDFHGFQHGTRRVYADALYCIPVCVLLLAFAVLTILKFRTGYDGNLKLAGIVWDVLFALAFLPILGVPAIAQASGAYGLLCKVLFVLVLLMPKVWILLPKRGE